MGLHPRCEKLQHVRRGKYCTILLCVLLAYRNMFQQDVSVRGTVMNHRKMEFVECRMFLGLDTLLVS